MNLDHWDFTPCKASKNWMAGGTARASEPTETVTLPHTWNATDTFQPGVAYRRGWGSYRCTVEIENLASYYYFRTGGFYGFGALWLNGQRVEEFDANWVAIIHVLSGLRAGTNHIALHVSNQYKRHVLPGIDEPDFVLHGGISATAKLIPSPEVFSISGYVSERQISYLLPLYLKGESFQWELNGQPVEPIKGDCMLRHESPNPPASKPTHSYLKLAADLERWDIDNPVLHTLSVTNPETGQHDELRFGIREAEFRPDQGFFLNGRRVELRGINRHSSIPGLGRAIDPAFHRDEARRIKDLGFNLVRLAHYPQDPAFLDACDEFGLLVYAEIATWKRVRGGRWADNAERQLRLMHNRDGHHPCLILTGLANEAQNRRVFERLIQTNQGLPSPRPTIYAENHLYRARREKTTDITDITGVNYELDILPEIRDASKNRVLLVCEMSNNPEARRGDDAEERRQCDILLADWNKLEDKPYVAGWCLWCWADYATLRKKRYLRWSGIVDAWRSPKMAADLVRARCLAETVLALHGDTSIINGTTEPEARSVTLISNRWPVTITDANGDREIAEPENGYLAEITCAFTGSDLNASAEGVASSLQAHGPHDHFQVEQDGPWALVSSRDTENRVVRTHEEVLLCEGEIAPWNPENRFTMVRGIVRIPLKFTEVQVNLLNVRVKIAGKCKETQAS